MAAPAEITIKDLTGDWVMNRTLSDDTDAVLALQGIGWFMRRALSLATVTLHVRQYLDGTRTNIDIDSTVTGGIKGTTENRKLDWQERPHSDYMFGNLVGRSEWIAPAGEKWDALEDYLKDGWEEGEEERGGPAGESHVHSWVLNEEKGWTAEQIWGFVIISEEEKKRYYARRVVVKKGEETLAIRLIYDWQGKKN